jgi:spermidine synthase
MIQISFKQHTRSPFLWTVSAAGLSSMTAQLVFVREYLALFSGNEYVIAMIFFTWLLSGSLGCLSAVLIEKSGKDTWPSLFFLGGLSIFLAALPLFMILSIRFFREILFISGSTPGFYQTFFFVLSTLSPYVLLMGLFIPLCLGASRRLTPEAQGVAFFAWDNLGNVLGGFLFSFFLVSFLTPMASLAVTSVPLAVCGFLTPGRGKPGLRIVTAAVAAITAVSCLYWEKVSLSPGYGKLVRYQESTFGRITVVDDNGQKTLFQDNVPVFSSGDIGETEQAVHYPLCQLDRPDRILVISGKSGMIGEIAKYGPRSVDWVEIDPAVTDALESFGMIGKIPGLRLVHTDARTFLDHADGLYDAVILNVKDPETLQANRYFTVEFFQKTAARLSPNGVFSFMAGGYDSYLGDTETRALSCLFNTVKKVFRNVLPMPGNTVSMVCSNGPLSPDIPALLEKKGIHTRFIRGYFKGDVTPERLSGLKSRLKTGGDINTDLSPVLVTRKFEAWFARYQSGPFYFLSGVMVLFGLYLSRFSRPNAVMFTTGFSLMTSEILTIFAYQVFFGNIYHRIGIIAAVFLSGLFPGALLAGRVKTITSLFYSDLLIVLLLLAFALGIHSPAASASPLLLLLCGFPLSLACGFQFAKIIEGENDRLSVFAGAFSADLAGAGFGVIFTSLVLIPCAGFNGALLFLVAFKSSSLFLSSR